MRIHHLNCATLHPYGGHFIDRVTTGLKEAPLVCHCLLIETHKGLVLIDTGFGMKDVIYPQDRISGFMRQLLRPILEAEETAARQIRAMGFQTSDVRHIILTHLDCDQVGGVDDFPHAQVHVMDAELRAAHSPKDFISKQRYSSAQLTSSSFWKTYYPEGERWFGFDTVRTLDDLPPEILLVPMPGHTEGHTAVAIETDEGWLLHAGDCYFYRGELNRDYNCPPALRGFQRLFESQRRMRNLNLLRLRDLAQNPSNHIRIFSTHDPVEFSDLNQGPQRLLAHAPEEYANILWMRRSAPEVRYPPY